MLYQHERRTISERAKRRRPLLGALSMFAVATAAATPGLAAQPPGPAPAQDGTIEEALQLSQQASALVEQNREAEAEAPARRAAEIAVRVLGKDDPDALAARGALAGIYRRLGKNAEAEAIYTEVLAARERVLGREDPSTLMAVNGLAGSLTAQGRYAQAEPLYRRLVEARERVFGAEDPETLAALNNLAYLKQQQGRLREAEPLYQRSLQANERLYGRAHPDTLTVLNNLAELYREQGRLEAAEPIYREVLQSRERVLGPTHRHTLTSAGSLGALLIARGQFAEAEPLVLRTREGLERTLGRGHPDTITALSNLAMLYLEQGRTAEAEPLYRSIIEVERGAWDGDHPEVLTASANLAIGLAQLGKHVEAETLLERTLAARERVLGPDHLGTIETLGNLAYVQVLRGRVAQAQASGREAVRRGQRVLGPAHPITLFSTNNLAETYVQQRRWGEAESLYRSAFEGSAAALGAAHPATLGYAENLATAILFAGSRPERALQPARLAVQGSRARRTAASTGRFALAQSRRERGRAGFFYTLFADAAWVTPGQRSPLQGEVFEALQDAMAGTANDAIARMAIRRYAEQNGRGLSELIREKEQFEEQWPLVSEQVSLALAGGEAQVQTVAELRAERTRIEQRLDAIDARLATAFPDYHALVRPQPVDLKGTQRLLRPDEAILLAVPSRFGTHVVAVTPDGFQWVRSEWTNDMVAAAVRRLRWDVGARVDGPADETAAWEAEAPASAAPSFSRGVAYQLYQQVVQPVAPLLGKRRVYVAAGGALAGLPFSLLVTSPPQGADNDPAALRGTAWLGDTNPLVHIPSIQSLALLRQARPPSTPRGMESFVGFGDPVLSGTATTRSRGAARAVPSSSRIVRAGTRSGGAMADVDQLSRLPRLPGTADELEALRRATGAPSSATFLGPRATEPAVRKADLSRAALLVFSTHGLTAEEAGGVGEAGLVLTPPAGEPTAENDGYLSASEVAALKINADWVILSACNTATGEGGEAQNLSGLARAFFYAGARSLLASHWPVSDDVAPVLTVRTIELERGGMPRAEAFQQAMREIRADASKDSAAGSWAHPFFWAPFVLMGDGGR